MNFLLDENYNLYFCFNPKNDKALKLSAREPTFHIAVNVGQMYFSSQKMLLLSKETFVLAAKH